MISVIFSSFLLTQIYLEAIVQGVDPKLAVSIAYVESKFDVNAVGSRGEIGLFQLRPEFHNVYKTNVTGQIIAGVNYLKRLEKKCTPKYSEAWFICFNIGPYRKNIIKEPKKFVYYQKVIAYYNYMETK